MRYTISSSLATLLVTTAAFADIPRVVTDIAPVQSLAAMVMGDLGSPDLLVDKGSDPHSFQLRPSQAASLQDANLILWVGPAMTPWLQRTLEELGSKAKQIAFLNAAATETIMFGDAAAHDHTAQATQADPDVERKDADQQHQGLDPHAWLDPHNAIAWLGLIATELATLDPDNSAVYAANAAKAAAEITSLDAEIKTLLAPIKAKPFVVYHDAYGYFAAHYGLTVAGELAIGDATSPSAAKLTDLRATLLSAAPVCIFPETNHDPKLLTQIAEGTPAAIGGALDPEGSALPPGPTLYPDLMRGLATTLAACLTKP